MAKPPKKYSNLSRSEISFLKKKLGITKIEEIDTQIWKDLKENLKNIKDTRQPKMIAYKLWDVIICVILASFAFNNTWEEIHQFVMDHYKWLKSFLQMTGGIPKADSYERIMSLVDAQELNKILLDFFKALTLSTTPEVELYNFDGRVNNGSKRKATFLREEEKPLNCLNCYSNRYRYCIETVPIDEKTNEIPTIEKLIKGMNLKGVIATWDALNSQTANVKAVIQAKGDYIIPIKGNQGNFLKDLEDYFEEQTLEKIKAGNLHSEYMRETEKSHSSIIEYEYYQTSDIKWYAKKGDWEGLRTFGLVKKTITKQVAIKKGKNTKYKMEKVVEYRYYISSKRVNIEEFQKATREHWSVENKIHWHLDFTFEQDKNKTLQKKALLNLEIIHKFVLASLEKAKPKYDRSLKLIRKHLSNNFEEFFPEFIAYLLLG